MDENNEKKQEKKPEIQRKSLTIGIGTKEIADRFLAVKNGTYAGTYEEAVKILLDAYENPPKDADSAATIANLQQRVDELETQIESKDLEIADLQAKLDAAISDANANAESSLGNQLQLEELRQRTDGAIILKPTAVEKHFLNLMAVKCGVTPERMLRKLFWEDLQNPMSNNFMDKDGREVSTPTTREIRQAIKDLTPQQQ